MKTPKVPLLNTLLLMICFTGCESAPPADPLVNYHDDVVVVLMGSPTCPGTRTLSAGLEEYNRTKPGGVTIVRVDVPPPGGKIKGLSDWNAGFPYEVDNGRIAADRLEFFFYPTLYIIDRDGEVRFRGGGEEEDIPEMVNAILAEKPGEEKRFFTAPMPAVGSPAASFSGTSLDGRRVSLDDLKGKNATILIFSSTTCPFSKKAMDTLPGLKSDFAKSGAAVVVVSQDPADGQAESFYAKKIPGIPVVSDPDRKISAEKYGVQSVPFFYVLDQGGCIAYRMPYSEEAARTALKVALGLQEKPKEIKAQGAG